MNFETPPPAEAPTSPTHRHHEKKNYNLQSPEEKFLHHLRRLNHIMHFRTESKSSQNRILELLARSGTMFQRDLTAQLDIQPGSASEILSKLEATGMILRAPCETDRRTQIVSLTEQGRQQAVSTSLEHRNRLDTILDCLSPEKKDMLISLLEEVSADWETRYPGSNHKSRSQEHHTRSHRRKER